jgi:hypothetical protein
MSDHTVEKDPPKAEDNSILAGYIGKETLAEELGYKSTRSIERLMRIKNGLQHITVRRKPYFDIQGRAPPSGVRAVGN